MSSKKELLDRNTVPDSLLIKWWPQPAMVAASVPIATDDNRSMLLPVWRQWQVRAGPHIAPVQSTQVALKLQVIKLLCTPHDDVKSAMWLKEWRQKIVMLDCWPLFYLVLWLLSKYYTISCSQLIDQNSGTARCIRCRQTTAMLVWGLLVKLICPPLHQTTKHSRMYCNKLYWYMPYPMII